MDGCRSASYGVTRRAWIFTLAIVIGLFGAASAGAQTTQRIELRGREQALRLYGPRTGDPVILSSGDGGWIHLAPHVAEFLASQGFYVIGFDAKAYLESFTSGAATLRPEDEPGDYRTLAQFAAGGTAKKPLLIGVSEGAGLSVLAASEPQTKAVIAGVIALGLPELNELGWRWKDALIYVTHAVPNEPLFRSDDYVGKVAPIPLAAIHSTGDEFVSVATVQKVLQNAKSPAKLWIVQASNHSFGDDLKEFDQRLLEALSWVKQNTPR